MIGVAAIMAACGGGAATPAPSKASPTTSTKPANQAAPSAGDVESGKRLFVSTACVTCHITPDIPEARGTVGPDLTGFASRSQIAGVLPNDTDNLKRWLANPPAVKPGTAMPNFNLNEQQINDLTAYLQTLK